MVPNPVYALQLANLMLVLYIMQIYESDIYYKDTHPGQYMHFSSYKIWNIKTAWIKALYSRDTKIIRNY